MFSLCAGLIYAITSSSIRRQSACAAPRFPPVGRTVPNRAGHQVTAGYLKKIGPRTGAEFAVRIINVHPTLLPRHGGQGMYGRQGFDAGMTSASMARARRAWRTAPAQSLSVGKATVRSSASRSPSALL
ncbi:formyltransferase family protein [Nocardia arthritidis]|uniref:formyltransferase family protein n=1 Tax=Nocardia arthritidis TaxID=228602 RepID=UPI00350E567E